MDTSFDLYVATLERRDVGAMLSILLLHASIQPLNVIVFPKMHRKLISINKVINTLITK